MFCVGVFGFGCDGIVVAMGVWLAVCVRAALPFFLILRDL